MKFLKNMKDLKVKMDNFMVLCAAYRTPKPHPPKNNWEIYEEFALERRNNFALLLLENSKTTRRFTSTGYNIDIVLFVIVFMREYSFSFKVEEISTFDIVISRILVYCTHCRFWSTVNFSSRISLIFIFTVCSSMFLAG